MSYMQCVDREQASTQLLFSFLVSVKLPAGEIAGEKSMGYVMLAGRLHRS